MVGSRVCLCLLAITLVLPAGASATVLHPADDAFVSGGNVTASLGGTDDLELKSTGDTANDLANSRKVYLHFDSASHTETTHHAELSLRLLAPQGQDDLPLRTWEFELYGLAEPADIWSQSTLTWLNAPGNSTTLGAGVNLSQVYGGAPLATFFIYGPGAAGDVVTISGDEGSQFVNFVTADTDHSLSFIIVRTSRGDKDDTVTHVFASSEYTPANGQAGDWAPTLTLLPEPTSLTLLTLASVAMLRRRRRPPNNGVTIA